MALIKKFYGNILKGKVIFDNQEEFKTYVGCLEGQRVFVTIQKEAAKRSNDQNAYYWGVVIQLISDNTGHTPDEVHEAMKMMFLKVPGTGGLPETIRSSAKLSTKDFGEFVEKVKRWAASSIGVYCPDAIEVEW